MGKSLVGTGSPAPTPVHGVMRCALYLRYSCKLQNQRSIEDQRRECKEYVKRRGWHLAEGQEYVDEELSGSLDDRPAYLALKEAAGRKQFDCVVVHDLSRLGRSAREGFAVFDEFEEHNVAIVGIADGVDTSERDEFLNFGMRAVVNQHFINDMRKKVMRGLKGRVIDGYSAGGRTYGFAQEKIEDPRGPDSRGKRYLGTRISIDPDEAKVVLTIFELKASGLGYRAIAKRLRADGIPSPRYKKKRSGDPGWAQATLVGILRNEKYRGVHTWNKFKFEKRSALKSRKKRLRPESEWVKFESEDLRIVPDDLWIKAQTSFHDLPSRIAAARQSNADHPELHYRNRYLFSGMLKCGECGGSMVVINSRGESAYSCNNHRCKDGCRNALRVSRALLEDVLLSEIQAHFFDASVIARLIDEMEQRLNGKGKAHEGSLKHAREKVASLTKRVDHMTEFVMGGDTSEAIRT